MPGAEFGFGELNEYQPMHAGVDWRLMYEAQCDEVPLPVWFQTVDEQGEVVQQLTQENCSFCLNNTAPEFDCVAVVDARDGEAWWFSRMQMGDEVFDNLLEKIGEEVLVCETKYPISMIAKYLVAAMDKDIAEIDLYGLPSEFDKYL